jgi:hypothetical protein
MSKQVGPAVTSKEVEQNFIDIRINENGEAGWRLT